MSMTSDKYPALTVEDLLMLCKQQVAKGNGKKKILISVDDEGNGYHGLFYHFTDDKESITAISKFGLFHDREVDSMLDDIIILG